MIRKSVTRFSLATNANAFARRSCSNKDLKRDDDASKSHRALLPLTRRSHKRPGPALLLPRFRQTGIASSFKNLEEPPVEVPMLYSQSPPLMADELSTAGLARDSDARSDQRIGGRRMRPSSDSPHYRFGEGPVASARPSLGRRLFRSLTRFFIAVLIGVGATLGWQSYGDEAREMLVAQAPVLGMLLPAPTTRSPVVAAAYTDPARQLAPMASALDAVRRSVEQLAAKQEQMAQNLAALRAVEDTRQKLPSTPPGPTAPAPPPTAAPAQQATSVPQPRPPQTKIDSRLPSAGSQFSR